MTTSTGLIVPLMLFRNFDRIPDCHVKTPWAFSQQVPAGQPVHVKIQIFDTDAIFDDEADLKVGDGDAIEFDVDPATGKWSGDINWPQNCSRPGLNLGGNNANVCWQASFDTDNDGLLDVWEKFGVDTNNDGIIDLDLPALGANPLRKDVFVETDYLAAPNHSHGPRKDAIDRIVASFANAPIANPDGTSGVQLHVDVGNLYGTGGFFSVVGPGGAVGTYGDFGGGNEIFEAGNEIIDAFVSPKGPGVKFADLEAANYDLNRGLVFRYSIFGHQTNARAAANDCTTGAIDPENRQFLVTLGGVDAAGQPCFGTEAGFSIGSSLEQSGTFMHDLGHALNLLHHGGFDDIDRKPNYLSVMNFDFQMCGVPTSPGLLPGVCDYSRSVAKAIPPPLDERSLDECIGIAGGLGFGPVDWNRNGVLEGETRCGPVSVQLARGRQQRRDLRVGREQRCGQYDPRGRRPDLPGCGDRRQGSRLQHRRRPRDRRRAGHSRRADASATRYPEQRRRLGRRHIRPSPGVAVQRRASGHPGSRRAHAAGRPARSGLADGATNHPRAEWAHDSQAG